MTLPISERDREFKNFKDRVDGNTERYVADEDSHTLLTSIANSLGAAVSTVVLIHNVSVPTSGVEVSYALPANVKSFFLKARGGEKVQLAFVSGESSTNFVTIPAGAVYTDDKYYSALTLYFQSNKNNTTIEIVTYV